jgi:hypothetical protein
MNRPSFLEGALVALIGAFAAVVTDTALLLPFPPREARALTIAALGLGYLLYVLARSGERTGRVLLVLAWVPITAGSLALAPGAAAQVLVQLGLVWLARVWCFQCTPTAAVLDLGLILVGAAAALWAGTHSGSLLLAVWSLLLIQAMFGAIPARPGHHTDLCAGLAAGPDPFDLGHRSAERALRRIAPSP